jgi:hypothetical protein
VLPPLSVQLSEMQPAVHAEDEAGGGSDADDGGEVDDMDAYATNQTEVALGLLQVRWCCMLHTRSRMRSNGCERGLLLGGAHSPHHMPVFQASPCMFFMGSGFLVVFFM